MVDFHGWWMPLYYDSVVREHRAVRARAGLFDVSHMGKIVLFGEGATSTLQRLLPSKMPSKPGVCRYSHLLDEGGRILDDVVVTFLGENRYLCVCNAGATATVLQWFDQWFSDDQIKDLTQELTLVALQGPASADAMGRFFSADVKGLRRFRGTFAAFQGDLRGSSELPVEAKGWAPLHTLLGLSGPTEIRSVYVTRTGYTGEDGFELLAPRNLGRALWLALLSEGGDFRVVPVGLGARDTLRLEKGYLLSGQDFDGHQTPLEVGYEWLIDWEHDFVGRDALLRLKGRGDYPHVVGVKLLHKGVPRAGNEIRVGDRSIGRLTSATLSPSLGVGIGLGRVKAGTASLGDRVDVLIRERRHPAELVPLPFL